MATHPVEMVSFMIFMIVALAEIKSKAFLGDKYEVSMQWYRLERKQLRQSA